MNFIYSGTIYIILGIIIFIYGLNKELDKRISVEKGLIVSVGQLNGYTKEYVDNINITAYRKGFNACHDACNPIKDELVAALKYYMWIDKTDHEKCHEAYDKAKQVLSKIGE